MKAYIWVTFALLGWAYYEMSGGRDFEPGSNGLSVFAKIEETALDAEAVARLSLVDMTSVGPVEGTDPPSDRAVVEAAVLAAVRSTDTAGFAESPVSMIVPADEAEASAETSPAVDLRAVNGASVNLRTGPGQEHPVLATLARGTTVQVLEDPGDGWVRLQVVPQGRIGWIADFLLDRS